MRPKFEVGEVVLLRSKAFPECNCETIVTGVRDQLGYGWLYKLEVKHHAPGYSDCWAESSLRKRHLPGELSFTNLMASLSSPKLLTHSPR